MLRQVGIFFPPHTCDLGGEANVKGVVLVSSAPRMCPSLYYTYPEIKAPVPVARI